MLKIPPALSHRRFRLLWLGLLISVAGTQMQIWALFWHIRTLTDQPIALGGVGLARILPVIIFSLIGGAIADTLNRRRIMLLTQTSLALLALALGWLTLQGHITLAWIYAITALQAVASAFDLPARQALVPNLVPATDLPSAFSLNSIAFQTGAIIGPAMSGLVIATLGQSYVYMINAVSFLAVILALVLMGPVQQEIRHDRLTTSAAPRPLVSLEAIKEGVQFILTHPIILSTMVLDFFATFFSSANTLMPIVARDVLKLGAVEYGWLSAAQAIGAVLAALVLSQVTRIRRQGPLFLVSVVAFGLATTFFGFTRSFGLAMLALILIGAADSVSTVIRNTIRQLQTPDYIRGRMTGINQIFFTGGPQLGEVEAGAVAQFFGAPFAIVSGGIGCIVAVAWILRRWPQLRTFDGTEPSSQPAQTAA
jgi:MFS family permease